ncbi:HAD-IIIA family hydrolase [Bdellovibrio sp. SKB1291214]|uniref:KdsC family phosphatase n=1 Tax=Bdellovibrio sp. SKB1291214 TaxID=1732569 RepID=UPI000B516685|nr:HAD-IIIA family hydrolase [Bdellovibrio sp. SKB1291214]UYL08997.1 HAD-IIIA family hydrolase [Bdellovibrio sp. SKB1291214]
MAIEISKLKNIKMLVLDVDGVMTDTRIWFENGEWRRFYSIRDGVGIKRLTEAGYKIAVITGTKAEDVRARAKSLGIHYFYEGALDKEPSFLQLQKESGISPNEMAYVGDDIFDIPLLQAVSFGATVPEAVDEVIEIADYVTKRPGGCGAVREVCDYIYKYGAFSSGR